MKDDERKIQVLVVDDEEPFRRLLKKELTRKGFAVEVAGDGAAALQSMKEHPFDVVLLDIVMPGVDGISVMKEMRGEHHKPAVVVLTGRATIETAVEAMKNGAYDYLTKPYKLDELEIIINRAYEYERLSTENLVLQQELIRKESRGAIIGRSRALEDVLALVGKIAATDSTVLITGESGTGKELIANTIWQMSTRRDRPFTALNCSTFSENLMESELFGHEKGAFTSAYQSKYGIVEVADKGTLFLDEIAEMPVGLQAKLLRFLDSGEFRRVGATRPLSVDVRVLAATNKDLQALVQEGSFREDLYYRLNVINIDLPPLRERKEDIPELAEHFVAKYASKLAKPVRGVEPAAVGKLVAYHWPGNVRELENEMERAVILTEGESIGSGDLSIPVTHEEAPAGTSNGGGPYLPLEEMEKDYILKVLRETGGNQSRASQVLGISRKTLYLKLKRYGISA
ncbi:MAG: sigma-54 dependent transcriptional regulator [Nitrospirota bacterium]